MMKSKMMAGGGAMKSKMMTSGGKMGMKKGGMPMVMKDGKKIPAFAAKNGGMTKMGAVKTSSKPDGVAVKGKTKGTMIKMKSGGKAC